MELRHLRYFIAVAEEENITRAAERLHLSQPPLSRQIRDLEQELKVPLLERKAKSIRLTPAGRVFLVEARAVLRRVDEALATTRATVLGKKQDLHVGYAPSPTSEFLSNLIDVFERAHPSVRVVLHEMSSSEMVTELRARRLQVALMIETQGHLPAWLKFERLRSYRTGVAVGKRHPFAKRRALRRTELLDQPLAALSGKEYPDYPRLLRRIFGALTRKLRVVEECDGAFSLIAAVESGRTVAVSSESMLALSGSRIVFVPFTPKSPLLNLGIAYDRRQPALSAGAHFVETAREVVATSNSAGNRRRPRPEAT